MGNVTKKYHDKIKKDLTPTIELFDDLSYAILQTYPRFGAYEIISVIPYRYPVDEELQNILTSLTPHLPESDRKPSDYPPLHYACYLGLRNLVRCFIHILLHLYYYDNYLIPFHILIIQTCPTQLNVTKHRSSARQWEVIQMLCGCYSAKVQSWRTI